MLNKDIIKKLADLSRLKLSEKEIGDIGKDLGSVLEYVSQLKNAPVSDVEPDMSHVNIMRDDEGAHESGKFTEKLLAEVPETKDGYVVVKQVMKEKKK